jgi:Polyketide cyclase / dehydrase and lipid transport
MRRLSVSTERHIAAAPDDIWAYRLDFLHLPEYNPSVRGIEQLAPSGPDGSGAHYRFELIAEDGSHPVDLRVIRSVPGQLVAIELGGEMPAEEEFTVSAVGGTPDDDGGAGSCQVAIALTLLVSDAIPTIADPQLLDDGTRQIGDELEQMARLLEAGTQTS